MSRSWQEAASNLESQLAGPLQAQAKLAGALGLELRPDVPAPVAAAILRVAVAPALMRRAPEAGGSVSHLHELEEELGLQPAPVGEVEPGAIISAWIECRYMEKRLRGLRALEPREGDVVKLVGADDGLMLVSSVDRRGRVHMKGGGGLGAWPDNLKLVARDGEHAAYRLLAANVRNQLANGRTRWDSRLTLPEKIAEYRVRRTIPDYLIVQELEDLLESGDGSEGPLQRFLERNPSLLAGTVIGNHGTYVIPQQAFGADYVADFVVLGINSAGPQWVLVELEASKHDLHNKDGSLKTAVRHAVGQIQDWREWLTMNADHAQRQQGLYGLTNHASGLVIIGRGQPSVQRDATRSQVREQNGIEVRSWDWILRQARQLAAHEHPSIIYRDGVEASLSPEEVVK